MSNKIDIKTLEALRQDSHEAFEEVFITYYGKTKAFIQDYIKSSPDAEELTEDLFVNLWMNRHSVDISRSFDSYLHTIARNSAINFLKHKYVEDTYLSSVQQQECSSTSEEDLIAKELGLLIDDTVEKMPEQRRKIYMLSRNEGLSNEEIAVRLNTTKRNVESQLSLALKEIRKTISYFFLLLAEGYGNESVVNKFITEKRQTTYNITFWSKVLPPYTRFAFPSLLYEEQNSEVGTRRVRRRYKPGTRQIVLFFFSLIQVAPYF